MAFSNNRNAAGPMADINVTPLVDVMLVLLIIFMITAPILAHKVEIDLPQKTTTPPQVKKDPPPDINLKIVATGELFWNGQPLIQAALEPQLKLEAAKDPQPQLIIEADLNTEYQIVAGVLATIKAAKMTKIGFKKENEAASPL